ncbi:FtsX-like permease family protein [uncultured Parabacteroides sp.]|uniref:ABC transporter permease n=1 Tax=uncultured Parabacteroides sp. TaxID=512312 RepID=UPI002584BC23|nr:FtsX-like permease family protein [uncultured Parabacteroides sp.]
MKTILRNFISVLRRFKMATLLNVLGLSIAFTAFMVIMMQVNYDYTFDSCQPEANSIYRMDMDFQGNMSAVISRPFARGFTESSPHIKAGMIMASWSSELFYSVEKNGERQNFQDPAVSTSPEITRVFHFDMVEGDETALDPPGTAMIPASMARRLFGNESAIGKQLISVATGNTVATINGVFKDFPRNSSIQNIIYRQMPPKENYDEWGNQNYFFFFRLDDPSNAADVRSNFKKNFDASQQFGKDFNWEKGGLELMMTPLPELHFLTNVSYDSMPKASRQTVRVLFAIAFIILLIAGINFTNFSTALTPMRIKSINTQKVLGSPDSVLRTGLLLEAVIVSILAYLISLGLLFIAGLSFITSLVDADMAFSAQSAIIIITAVIAVVVGVLAGIYPACYITSFPPALVLKGSFGLSPKGRILRSTLVSIQFVASFILIIGSLFMFLQNRYMQNTPLGYDKDELIVIELNNKINENRSVLVSEVKSFSGIEDITYAEQVLSSRDYYMGWGRTFKDKDINFQCIPVSPSFLRVMGITVTDGRDFRDEDDLKDTGCYIFNEKAREMYELELGDKIEKDEIIGFIPNVKFASFRNEVSPMTFYVWGKYRWGSEGDKYYNAAYVKVKAGSDLRAAMKHIKASLTKIDPVYPFKTSFYNEILQRTYEKELKISNLITLFSVIAIFISIVGVFGLVVFESEYRRREVAVRKVLGSSTSQILVLFNKGYLFILIICFILAAPVAFYGVYRWLENFAYRTPMYWWVFLVSFILVSIITFITVTFQNWHVANSNPVDSMKTE